jgi:hypothetical protein
MSASGVLTGWVQAALNFTEAVTIPTQIPAEDLALLAQSSNLPWMYTAYPNGTGAGSCDTPWWSWVNLQAAAQTFNLTSLIDPGGGLISFGRVRDFFVLNPSLTAGYDLKIYQGSADGWAPLATSSNPGWARAAGGWFWLHDPQSSGAGNGNVVTDTSCTFTLDPGGNSMRVLAVAIGGSVP